MIEEFDAKVIYAVREIPIINDAILEDAIASDLQVKETILSLKELIVFRDNYTKRLSLASDFK